MNDEEILISCGECSASIQGVHKLQTHILNTHKYYTPEEAVQYAEIWLLDAIEEVRQEEMAYAHSQCQKSKGGKYYVP